MRNPLKIVALACALTGLSGLLAEGFAADRYWVGGTSTSWSDVANWSTTSGGAGGASKPGTADKAIFDGNSNACLMNQTIDVGGIHMTSAFSNTLTHSSSNLTVQSLDFVIDGGTFAGGSALIDVRYDFYYNGGNFTSTSDRLLLRADAVF